MLRTRLRVPISNRPRLIRHGESAFPLPRDMVEKYDEVAVGMQLLCNRPLFGECYRRLAGKYFGDMPRNSGVLVAGFVPSADVLDMSFPGDIDLLIVPYEEGELVVSRTLAIELKVVRASFENQGKSPDRFGFSQAESLLDHGFPFAAVGHLIVSDTSPKYALREVLIKSITDPESGKVEDLGSTKIDMMPADLIERSFGRLKANRSNQDIGLLSAYFSETKDWQSMGMSSQHNAQTSRATLHATAAYYKANYNRFMDIPRYPR